jgi:UDP-glucose 4-epimerase
MADADGKSSSGPATVDLRRAFDGKPVLVAGADGFLGVNCAAKLHALGARVTLLSRRAQPRAAAFAVRHVQADLRDVESVAAAVEGQACVFDLAGSSGAVVSNIDPAGSADLECRPHLTLFAAAADSPARPVLSFCSSRLVYGKPDRLPVAEDHPVRPASFYAIHKLTLEHYLRVLAATRGLRACILRLSNPYGPYWPEELKSYGLINRFIARALEHRPIEIFGQGLQQRDYVHVDDFITAMLTTSASEACWGETFNMGGETAISIRHAAETIAAEIAEATIVYRPWPAEHLAVETGDYQTDLSKLRRYVQLPAQLTFPQGLRRTLEAVRAGLPTGRLSHGK